MSHMHASTTALQGLMRIQRRKMQDARGSFSRLFCVDELAEFGWTGTVAQLNISCTQRKGTVRGMHFQYPPHAEIKLVSCIRGAVWDVAVDLRANSPTYLQWQAVEISADNQTALLIPPGFVHGFQSLSDDCELIYAHSVAYAPQAEGGICPTDTALAITWPLPISEMSDRDRSHPLIDSHFKAITL